MKAGLVATLALAVLLSGCAHPTATTRPAATNAANSYAASTGDAESIPQRVPAVATAPAAPYTGGLPLDEISLPAGFSISLYCRAEGARSLCLTPGGTLFIGSREPGKVYAAVDQAGVGHADQVYTIARGRDNPNGVAFRDGSLYVAEASRIIRFDGIEQHLADPSHPQLVRDSLPPAVGHRWKYLRFGPDGKLYFNLGASGNILLPPPPTATIQRMNTDGSDMETYARGVRMSVGQDWDPATGELWFTDNGRDNLGDNEPPDELNHAPHAGMHFGFPFCHGGEILDPEYGARHSCADYTAPALKLPAHVAPLGMRFYTGKSFPAHYQGGIFLCEHGSWNRSSKIGYQVIFVPMRDGKPQGYEVFAQGWLRGQQAWGRPVDLEIMPDGSLLVSDDQLGAVYRIRYGS